MEKMGETPGTGPHLLVHCCGASVEYSARHIAGAQNMFLKHELCRRCGQLACLETLKFCMIRG